MVGVATTRKMGTMKYELTASRRLNLRMNAFSLYRYASGSGSGGELVRVKDVGRVELGAQTYSSVSQLNGKPSATMAIYQSPGSNALDISSNVRATMDEIQKNMPEGVEYRIVVEADENGANMSNFDHFADYTGGLGGVGGAFEHVNISEIGRAHV